jgi:hypothetical protein
MVHGGQDIICISAHFLICTVKNNIGFVFALLLAKTEVEMLMPNKKIIMHVLSTVFLMVVTGLIIIIACKVIEHHLHTTII